MRTCNLGIGAALALVAVTAFAQVEIVSLQGNGRLVCSNLVAGSTATVEWASAAAGPWTNSWDALGAVEVGTDGLLDVSVPMFYRVRGGPPAPAGMVYVEGGTLPDIGNGVLSVSSFQIGKYTVTWAEWQTVRAEATTRGYDLGTVGDGCAGSHPVHTVNWYDVVKWCNLRSEIEGRTPVYRVDGSVYKSGQHDDVTVTALANGYRLPTDAEWEFAARGGTQSQGYIYSGGDDLGAVGWYMDNSAGAACNYWGTGRGTWPVGLKAANELGLHDMSGNVWEWCFDWYPGSEGSERVNRGGSWGDDTYTCRVVKRDYDYPDVAYNFIGFRPVLPPGQ